MSSLTDLYMSDLEGSQPLDALIQSANKCWSSCSSADDQPCDAESSVLAPALVLLWRAATAAAAAGDTCSAHRLSSEVCRSSSVSLMEVVPFQPRAKVTTKENHSDPTESLVSSLLSSVFGVCSTQLIQLQSRGARELLQWITTATITSKPKCGSYFDFFLTECSIWIDQPSSNSIEKLTLRDAFEAERFLLRRNGLSSGGAALNRVAIARLLFASMFHIAKRNRSSSSSSSSSASSGIEVIVVRALLQLRERLVADIAERRTDLLAHLSSSTLGNSIHDGCEENPTTTTATTTSLVVSWFDDIAARAMLTSAPTTTTGDSEEDVSLLSFAADVLVRQVEGKMEDAAMMPPLLPLLHLALMDASVECCSSSSSSLSANQKRNDSHLEFITSLLFEDPASLIADDGDDDEEEDDSHRGDNDDDANVNENTNSCNRLRRRPTRKQRHQVRDLPGVLVSIKFVLESEISANFSGSAHDARARAVADKCVFGLAAAMTFGLSQCALSLPSSCSSFTNKTIVVTAAVASMISQLVSGVPTSNVAAVAMLRAVAHSCTHYYLHRAEAAAAAAAASQPSAASTTKTRHDDDDEILHALFSNLLSPLQAELSKLIQRHRTGPLAEFIDVLSDITDRNSYADDHEDDADRSNGAVGGGVVVAPLMQQDQTIVAVWLLSVVATACSTSSPASRAQIYGSFLRHYLLNRHLAAPAQNEMSTTTTIAIEHLLRVACSHILISSGDDCDDCGCNNSDDDDDKCCDDRDGYLAGVCAMLSLEGCIEPLCRRCVEEDAEEEERNGAPLPAEDTACYRLLKNNMLAQCVINKSFAKHLKRYLPEDASLSSGVSLLLMPSNSKKKNNMMKPNDSHDDDDNEHQKRQQSDIIRRALCKVLSANDRDVPESDDDDDDDADQATGENSRSHNNRVLNDIVANFEATSSYESPSSPSFDVTVGCWLLGSSKQATRRLLHIIEDQQQRTNDAAALASKNAVAANSISGRMALFALQRAETTDRETLIQQQTGKGEHHDDDHHTLQCLSFWTSGALQLHIELCRQSLAEYALDVFLPTCAHQAWREAIWAKTTLECKVVELQEERHRAKDWADHTSAVSEVFAPWLSSRAQLLVLEAEERQPLQSQAESQNNTSWFFGEEKMVRVEVVASDEAEERETLLVPAWEQLRFIVGCEQHLRTQREFELYMHECVFQARASEAMAMIVAEKAHRTHLWRVFCVCHEQQRHRERFEREWERGLLLFANTKSIAETALNQAYENAVALFAECSIDLSLEFAELVELHWEEGLDRIYEQREEEGSNIVVTTPPVPHPPPALTRPPTISSKNQTTSSGQKQQHHDPVPENVIKKHTTVPVEGATSSEMTVSSSANQPAQLSRLHKHVAESLSESEAVLRHEILCTNVDAQERLSYLHWVQLKRLMNR